MKTDTKLQRQKAQTTPSYKTEENQRQRENPEENQRD